MKNIVFYACVILLTGLLIACGQSQEEIACNELKSLMLQIVEADKDTTVFKTQRIMALSRRLDQMTSEMTAKGYHCKL